jgi:hypothetical protein
VVCHSDWYNYTSTLPDDSVNSRESDNPNHPMTPEGTTPPACSPWSSASVACAW